MSIPRVLSLRRTAVLVLIGLACTAASAQMVLQQIALRGQINLGYRVDASPFSFRDGQGKPVGYMLDLCQSAVERVQAATGKVLRVNPVEVSADQVVRYLQAGTVDLLCSATSDTPERRAAMAFSYPVFIAHTRMLVRSADGISQVDQLRDQSVVVIGRTTAYTLLPPVFSSEPIAIAVRPGDPQLLKAVNDALVQANRSGLLEAAYQRWFLGPVPPFNRPIQLPMSSALKDELARWR